MTEEACLELLISRQHESGAFRVRDNGEGRPDATAWAALALRAEAGHPELAEKARRHLLREQLQDGRLVAAPHSPSACWPTPLALLAWHGWQEGAAAAKQAIQFLDQVRVLTWDMDPYTAIDSRIKGWSWIAGTSCWVEPTALAIFALERYGVKNERTGEGVRLLLDRQLPKGGWNYGNTVVFGSELYPTEETVGVALTALAGHCEKAEVERSLRLLEQRLQKVRTPLTLAWGILGMAAWGERPDNANRWIAECLERQQIYGNFDTTQLSLLLIAARCTGGLADLFPPTATL